MFIHACLFIMCFYSCAFIHYSFKRNTEKWLNILLKYSNCEHSKIFKVCLKIVRCYYNAEESCVEKILTSFFDNTKDKEKIKILLKTIERVYTKNSGMQKLIDESMADVFKEDGVSPEQVFFVFAVGFTVMGINIIFCVCEGQLMKKLRVYF